MPKTMESVQSPDNSTEGTLRKGCHQSVNHQDHQSLKELIKLVRKDLKGEKERKIGFIYIVREKSGYVKIGSSNLDNDSQSAVVEKCKFRLVHRQHTGRFAGAFRCEQIVHKALPKNRYLHHTCDCRSVKRHREWYWIEVEKAMSYIELVWSWMLLDPYESISEDGRLKPEWRDAVKKFEESLESRTPQTLKDLFPRNDSLEWDVLFAQQTPTHRPLSFRTFDFLHGPSPGSRRSDRLIANSTNSDGSNTTTNATGFRPAKTVSTPYKDETPVRSRLSTPSKQPTRPPLMRSSEREKQELAESRPRATPKGKNISAPTGSKSARSTDRSRRFADTPSKPTSRGKIETHCVESDSDDENSDEDYKGSDEERDHDDGDGDGDDDDDDDDDYDDDDDDEDDEDDEEGSEEEGSEEEGSEEDTLVDSDLKSPLKTEEPRYSCELNPVRRPARGRKSPVQAQKSKLGSHRRGFKCSSARHVSSDSTNPEDGLNATKDQSDRQTLRLGPRTGARIGKRLPSFHVDPVVDLGNETDSEDDNETLLTSKQGTEHRRRISLMTSGLVPAAKTELPERPRSSAGVRTTNGLDNVGKKGKAHKTVHAKVKVTTKRIDWT